MQNLEDKNKHITMKQDIGKVQDGERAFAKTSKFYRKIMEDGEIFNPYIHRRFLPVQYLYLMQQYENNVHKGISVQYIYMYSVNFLKEEVEKLAKLERKSPIAFVERKEFFTLEIAKEIISDYVRKADGYIDALSIFGSRFQPYKYIPCRGRISAGYYKIILQNKKAVEVLEESEEIKEIKMELKMLQKQVNECSNYIQLNHVLQAFKFIKLPKETKKSKAFVEAFKKSGAYYTLKYLCMFEKCHIDNLSTKTSLLLIRSMLISGYEAYRFHALLKKVIEDNRFSLSVFLGFKPQNSNNIADRINAIIKEAQENGLELNISLTLKK